MEQTESPTSKHKHADPKTAFAPLETLAAIDSHSCLGAIAPIGSSLLAAELIRKDEWDTPANMTFHDPHFIFQADFGGSTLALAAQHLPQVPDDDTCSPRPNAG